MIASLLIAAGLCGLAQEQPPPLSADQLARVRALVKSHQEEQTRLKGQLEKAQQRLADQYAHYKLDDAEVKKAHQAILDVQLKLLQSYDGMQKELRSIVGPERFRILSQRIDRALRNPPAPKKP